MGAVDDAGDGVIARAAIAHPGHDLLGSFGNSQEIVVIIIVYQVEIELLDVVFIREADAIRFVHLSVPTVE